MIIFPAKIERADTVIVDGYSDRKTFEGAVKDFGRFIEKKFKNGEGQALIDTIEDGISETNQIIFKAETSDGGYFFEVEEVPCASRYNDFNEMEYKEANYYICMRFIK